MNTPIRHILLDIEGTTCPVRFVSETLFPYAAERMGEFLASREGDPEVQELVSRVVQAWGDDPDPAAQALFQAAPSDASPSRRVLPYLHWLIQQDRKLTPLKDLQGLIWEEGYESGALQGPLYPDVAPALRRWQRAGLGLAVYSSGSVKAQQLIYGHSRDGDLRFLFSHWFDTRTGPKQEASSYTRICEVMQTPAERVLFISDAIAELDAASAAGLAVIFSKRDGNPEQNPSSYAWISSLMAIQISNQAIITST
jgi:enolase-phosphatase E1